MIVVFIGQRFRVEDASGEPRVIDMSDGSVHDGDWRLDGWAGKPSILTVYYPSGYEHVDTGLVAKVDD